MKITIKIERRFHTPASAEQVFELLADVPTSASHFPKLERIREVSEDIFQWELEPVGPPPYSTQPVYACRYHFEPENGEIRWEPVEGVGNVELSGEWVIRSSVQSTEIHLVMKGILHTPLPSLMRFVAEPLITREFESYVDQYVENLQRTFGGNEQ